MVAGVKWQPLNSPLLSRIIKQKRYPDYRETAEIRATIKDVKHHIPMTCEEDEWFWEKKKTVIIINLSFGHTICKWPQPAKVLVEGKRTMQSGSSRKTGWGQVSSLGGG